MTEPKKEIVPADRLPERATDDLARRGLKLLGSSPTASRNREWLAARAKLLPYLLTLSGPDIVADRSQPLTRLVVRQAETSAGLTVVLIQNEPDHVAYVTPDLLASWGVSDDEAWTSAYANLDAHLDDVVMVLKATGLIHVLGWENPRETLFAATLLLSSAFRRMLCATLDTQRCVVGIPNRELLVAMAPEFEGMDEVVDYFRHEVLLYDHGISGESFLVHSSGAWEHIDAHDGFVQVLGRSLVANKLDEPYMGLPDIWSMDLGVPLEPWVRHYSETYFIDHPESWRVETDKRITNLARPEPGEVTISWYRKNPKEQPFQVHEARRLIDLQFVEQKGYQTSLQPRVRRMHGWTGVYKECTQQTPHPMTWLILAACQGHTIVLVTADDPDTSWLRKLEYLRVFNSLVLRHG